MAEPAVRSPWALDAPASRRKAALGSALGFALVALVDWKLKPDVSLGLFYVLPILVLSAFLERRAIVALAAACTLLKEAARPDAWDADAPTRCALGFVAFLASGLFVSEMARNRRLALAHGRQLARQVELREEARERLRVLVESSPAAILTVDSRGGIDLANDAAVRLLALDRDPPGARRIESYLPALASVAAEGRTPPTPVRTCLECMGRTAAGDVFLAHVWFSTYETRSGPELAAIVLDASEQLRDREELGLSALAVASRVAFGAVSHEVRNLAGAAAAAHANLAREVGLAGHRDFEALGSLVGGLERLASADLSLSAERALARVSLHQTLGEFRVVLKPALADAGARLAWSLPDRLPPVWGDHHGLLQVFLNLGQNSLRAMAASPEKELRVAVTAEEWVDVRFRDTGPGAASPERLFRPFQDGSDATGLGLYVSRAIARSFAGDLSYETTGRGGCFLLRLVPAENGAVS